MHRLGFTKPPHMHSLASNLSPSGREDDLSCRVAAFPLTLELRKLKLCIEERRRMETREKSLHEVVLKMIRKGHISQKPQWKNFIAFTSHMTLH